MICLQGVFFVILLIRSIESAQTSSKDSNHDKQYQKMQSQPAGNNGNGFNPLG